METIPWMIVLHWILLGAGSHKDSSLPVPRLSSSIQHNFVIKGEEISLNCSLPKGVESGSPEGPSRIMFFFYCRDQSFLPIEDQFLTNNTFNFRTGHLNSSQIKIICTCKIGKTSEGSTLSSESNHLVFSVIDGLPSPVLKVEPLSQRVKEGDPLLFLCSTEGDNAEKKFHYYKDGVEITSRGEGPLDPSTEPTNPLQNASLRIPHASFNHSGEFACSYEEKRSNRWVKSSLSQGVKITIGPDLPPPVLKLHTSSGSPGEGKVLSILCVSSENNNSKRFHFSKDGVEMTSSHEVPVKSSRNSGLLTLNMSVAFPYATNKESLGFACRYEENINGRWIMSPWSETITDEPVWNRDFNLIRNFPRLAYLIVLLFPLALYCWKNKSKPEVTYSDTENVFTPSPPGPTLKSQLRQEEEEEITYYNAAF